MSDLIDELEQVRAIINTPTVLAVDKIKILNKYLDKRLAQLTIDRKM